MGFIVSLSLSSGLIMMAMVVVQLQFVGHGGSGSIAVRGLQQWWFVGLIWTIGLWVTIWIIGFGS